MKLSHARRQDQQAGQGGERVNAGLARAREQGRVGGRPRVPADVERRIRGRLAEGTGIRKVVSLEGVGVPVVQRVKAEGQRVP